MQQCQFVRGDAIAGILIMMINIVGGLVAQIPALVISTAAGVIVTRVGTHQDVGQQMVDQLFNKPQVMLLAAGVLGLLGLVPGMPNLVFLLFTALLLGLAWWLKGRRGGPTRGQSADGRGQLARRTAGRSAGH